jgi:predicted small secreted protein
MTSGIKSRITGASCAKTGTQSARWLIAEFGLLKNGNTHSALEVKMKKQRLLPWLLLAVLTLQGCATLRGIGEDIQSLGRALKRAVSE